MTRSRSTVKVCSWSCGSDSISCGSRESGDAGPGDWFSGPFVSLVAAGEYARFLAGLGRQGIRERCALPEFWNPGSAGNPVEVLRTYRLEHEAPGISSAAARQREGAQPDAGGRARGYGGEGWQVTLPCRRAQAKFGLALVSRVPGAELAVSKP